MRNGLKAHLLSGPAGEQWKAIGIRHHHGVNVPLFALHSQQSCGIGEYPDLLPVIGWCARLGLDLIQLLPLNDTGPDTSPYNALSALALNPLHLGLAALPNGQGDPQLQEIIQTLQAIPLTPRIDYETVRTLKERYLRLYFQREFPSISKSSAYRAFITQHPWLMPYAVFKALKTERRWEEPWCNWPASLSSAELSTLAQQRRQEVDFHSFIQFLCFGQLQGVYQAATEQGVFLKGDIPILVSPESADVWHHPAFFIPDLVAGAPPDHYADEGQYWGFPLFNWEAIEADHYSWWINRLQVAAGYMHLYRIDHIVGFFRIWAIPIHMPAKEGHFHPEEEAVWIDHGQRILEMMLHNCPLLPIGEDLGSIPPPVRTCMEELGICGTKVMRWERRWELDRSYIPIWDYPPISMTTVSTHDSDTLGLWWRNAPEEAQAFADFKQWDYSPELTLDQRREILRDSHQSSSFFHLNLLQEYFALFPELAWPDPEDERINFPGIISPRNWSYRFRPSVEQFTAHTDLQHAIQGLLSP